MKFSTDRKYKIESDMLKNVMDEMKTFNSTTSQVNQPKKTQNSEVKGRSFEEKRTKVRKD